MQYRIEQYDEATTVLMPSDADKLAASLGGPATGSSPYGPADPPPVGPASGAEASPSPLTALCLSFNLPKSCYATVFLRELTKQPMDKAHHTSLGESPNKTDVGEPKASVPDPVEPPKSADMELEETELENAPECSGDLAGGASADGAS